MLRSLRRLRYGRCRCRHCVRQRISGFVGNNGNKRGDRCSEKDRCCEYEPEEALASFGTGLAV
eukprot:4480015-Pleurochrysis_carterae.AAC.1